MILLPASIAVALGLALAIMSLTFLLARLCNNYSIVDVIWAAGFTPLALVHAAFAHLRYYDAKLDAHPEWHVPRAALLVLMVALWSLRLAFHLARRIHRHHPAEDVRYARLRQQWGPRTHRRMYGFYLLQGFFQWLLSLPFLIIAFNPHPPGPLLGLHPLEALGCLLWLTGLAGEALADRQLQRHRRQAPGTVCRSGLWKHSRHPNYFFEWLVWVGFALFALPAPWGWTALLAPLLIYATLVHFTGVPMTEALSIESKGDAYRAYQQTTNAFFPGPGKRPATR